MTGLTASPPKRGAELSELVSEFNRVISDAQSDAARIAQGLSSMAREYGMSRLARETGLSRESLYKTLSGTRSPDFATILKILNALGLDMSVRPKTASPKDPL